MASIVCLLLTSKCFLFVLPNGVLDLLLGSDSCSNGVRSHSHLIHLLKKFSNVYQFLHASLTTVGEDFLPLWQTIFPLFNPIP